jgi:hypothetical protein
MLAECKTCKAIVDAAVIASHDSLDEDMGIPERYTFASCPRCNSPLLLIQNQWGDEWDNPDRLYPARDDVLSFNVPKPIREAFLEATRCLNTKAYTASAIMCRKTLEGVCAQHRVDGRSLQEKLATLRDMGFIEGRLYQWAEELRLAGNEAAHDVGVNVGPQDASDAVEFTRALLEYAYTFQHRFDEFKKRRAAAKAKVKKAPPR